MQPFNKSITHVVIFLTILLLISTTTFSQKKKHQHKKFQKVETKPDSSQKKQTPLRKVDTLETQKIKIYPTNNQNLKSDTIKEEIIKTKNEIQKQLQVLLSLNNSNFESLKNIIFKKDSTFNLRLDTLAEQTKPEGFLGGFIKNSVYTWLYDTIKNIFSSNKDASGSSLLRVFTFLAIITRFFLLIYRIKEYFGKEEENNKPKKWRLIVSILSWLTLVYSFLSYSQNKEEENLININNKLKQIEIKSNQQIKAASYTDFQFNTILQAIDKKTNPPKQQLLEYKEIESHLKTQGEILRKSQKEIENQILILTNEQTNAEINIIDKIKDYSIHGFWIFFFILIIIFNKDIRNLLGKIYDSF